MFSPAWYSVRIVGRNCTLLPEKVLTAHKTITAAQDTKAIQEIVRPPLSEEELRQIVRPQGYLM